MSADRVRMAKLVLRRDAGREFDVEFWRRVGAEGRFAAMWQLVKEAQAIRGGDGHQPRLGRSVQKLKRLKSRKPRGGRERSRREL